MPSRLIFVFAVIAIALFAAAYVADVSPKSKVQASSQDVAKVLRRPPSSA